MITLHFGGPPRDSYILSQISSRNLFDKVPVNCRNNQLFQTILSGNELSCSFVSANSWEAIILIYDNAKSAEFKTTESQE